MVTHSTLTSDKDIQRDLSTQVLSPDAVGVSSEEI